MLPLLTNFNHKATKCTWECLTSSGCNEWAEKLIDAVDCLPLAVTLLASLVEVLMQRHSRNASRGRTLQWWKGRRGGCVHCILYENRNEQIEKKRKKLA